MHIAHQRSRVRSTPLRLVVLLAVCVFPTAVPYAASRQATSAAPPVARWSVTWTITANGSSQETTNPGVATTYNAASSRSGSATFLAQYASVDDWSGAAPAYSVTLQGQEDDYWRISTCSSYLDHLAYHVADPQQYAHWSLPHVTMYRPHQAADGTWSMREPTDITEASLPWNWALHRSLTQCDGTQYRWDYLNADGSHVSDDAGQLLQGNADGTVFTGSHSYDNLLAKPPQHVTRTVTAVRLDAGTPHLKLDSELLDRSIFLNQVPVDDRFDANVDWGNASGGTVDWRLGPAERQSGDTSATVIPDHIDVGSQGAGQQQLTARAIPDAGTPSNTEAKKVVVAPPPAWCGSTSLIVAVKKSASVAYQCAFAWPDPAFEAQMTTPSWLPFFRGQPVGITKTQLSAEMEVKSTGEGSVEGKAQAGFVAMGGGPVVGSVKLHGDMVLTQDGIKIPAGGVDFSISGKIKQEEGLLDAIPTLQPVMITIDRLSPAASQFLRDHAKARLELEPKLVLGFNFEDKNGGMVFKNATLTPGMGFKVIAEFKLIDDLLTATASVGGAANLTLQVPSPYFKQIDLKFAAGAKIELGVYTLEATKEYSWSSAGMIAPGRPPASGTSTAGAAWQLMDRGYLTAADYAHWTGVATTTAGVDQQLVAHVFPHANPALATRSGTGEQYLVWSHDKPGTDALNGQDLMFAKGGSGGWASAPKQLTNDSQADLNPQIVTLPNGNVMVLWQRIDTATPGDINADPQAYLSHFQVAAGSFAPGAASPTLAPQQLSTSGSLNQRPHIGALADGALAVWVNNPASHILGDATSPDTIYARHYMQATNTWSAAAPVVSNVAGLLSVQLATNGAQAAMVYTVDGDGDITTSADRELYYVQYQNGIWGSPQRLTNNGVADEDPHLALTATGTPLLVWQQAGRLVFLTGSWAATPVTLPFAVDAEHANWDLVRGKDNSLALTWQQLDGNDTGIGYALYDGVAGQWSSPQTIVPPAGTHTAEGTSAFLSHVAPVLVAGEAGVSDRLLYAYQLAQVASTTATVEGVAVPNQPQVGAQTLRIGSLPLGTNLRVTAADVRALPVTAQAGQPVAVNAAIHNTGQRSIAGATATLVRRPLGSTTGETVVGTQALGPLAGGTAVTTTFSTTRPALADQEYLVRVTANPPAIEADTSDNEAVLGAELAGAALPTIYTQGGALLELEVRQQGGIPSGAPVSAALTLDRPDGPRVALVESTFPVTPTDSIVARTWLPASAVGPGHHQLFWTLDPDGRLGEVSSDHRVVATSADMLPDLTTAGDLLSWDRRPGNSASYRVPVQNTGAYTSTGGLLALYDGVPGQATTHLLAQQPLPAIGSGATAVMSGMLPLAGLPEATAGLQGLYVVLDPDNAVAEITKNNNVAIAGTVTGAAGGGARHVFLPLVKR